MRNIVVFKAHGDSEDNNKDPYYSGLLSAGFNPLMIPVLDFQFEHLDLLLGKLKTPENYTGLIFTSPRSVQAVRLATENDQSLLNEWKQKTNYVVGQATDCAVQNIGLKAEGKTSGNANNLADIITKCKYGKPFLYPIGSLTKDSFKLQLAASHVELDEVIVYVTKAHNMLESNIRQASLESLAMLDLTLVYFSPSGVQFTLPIFKSLDIDLTTIKFVAIGPSTKKALSEAGCKVHCTAVKPNAEELLQALLSSIPSQHS